MIVICRSIAEKETRHSDVEYLRTRDAIVSFDIVTTCDDQASTINEAIARRRIMLFARIFLRYRQASACGKPDKRTLDHHGSYDFIY